MLQFMIAHCVYRAADIAWDHWVAEHGSNEGIVFYPHTVDVCALAAWLVDVAPTYYGVAS